MTWKTAMSGHRLGNFWTPSTANDLGHIIPILGRLDLAFSWNQPRLIALAFIQSLVHMTFMRAVEILTFSVLQKAASLASLLTSTHPIVHFQNKTKPLLMSNPGPRMAQTSCFTP